MEQEDETSVAAKQQPSSPTGASGIIITCSWLEAKSSLSAAFTYRDRNDEGGGGWCIGEAENCVLLQQKDDSEEPLWIRFECSDPTQVINKLHILSEASYVEVYGLFEEYIKTVTGELLDDVDGTLAFSCLLDGFDLSQLKLKFVRLKGAKKIWLFGGCVWTKKEETSSKTGCGRINMAAVDSRLDRGKFQLSPSADSLKKLVVEYLERGGEPPRLGDLPSLRPSPSLQSIDFIKKYMDSSLKSMENRLMQSLTDQMRELELRQNKRLDHILKLLESSSAASQCEPEL